CSTPAARSRSPSAPPTSAASATWRARCARPTSSSRPGRRPFLPRLLLEIGCEELPASACREALAQLPELCRAQLDVEPAQLLVGPRRLALIAEGVDREPPREWVKGPP